MQKPCLTCGELSDDSRCPAHKRKTTPPRVRGYDWHWRQLSETARKLQPWCSNPECLSPNNLQLHHTEAGWALIAAGIRPTMKHIAGGLFEVLCGECNRSKPPVRPPKQWA